MALIQCPECGKEISDKALTCPSCGCPIKAEEPKADVSAERSNEIKDYTDASVKNKKLIPIIIGVAAAVIVLLLVVIIAIPKKSSKEEVTTEISEEEKSEEIYKEAKELIESGDYEGAKEKFDTIPDYKDVPTILDQIPWETRTFVCVDILKNMLKSPDSLKIYDVVIFSKDEKEDAKLDQEMIDEFKDIFDPEEEAPVIAIHYGGENTMGGMTDSVTLFVMDKNTHEYFAYGDTKTLDKNEADEDEENVVFLFDTMDENFKRTGDVDVNRINAIIKSGVYTNVKIIDD